MTPVVDFLVERPDVDPARIGIIGWSFGGWLVVRAAAFERRLAAVIADPGMVDSFAAWRRELPPPLLALVRAGDRDAANQFWAGMLAEVPPSTRFQITKRSEIYGQADAYDRIRHMLRFRCDDVAHLVTAPT